jgi:hypothetical protein
MLPQDRGEAGQRAPLAPEQKRSQIRIREQRPILLDLKDPPHPRATDRIEHHQDHFADSFAQLGPCAH